MVESTSTYATRAAAAAAISRSATIGFVGITMAIVQVPSNDPL